MPAFNRFNVFSDDLCKGVHNLSTDTLKLMLTNTAPSAANAGYSDVSGNEITGGNGYTTGGITLTSSLTSASGVAKLTVTDFTLTASGGPIGPYQYAIAYNDTSTGKRLIGWYVRSSAVTLADTESDNFDFDDANGMLQVGA